MEGEGDDLICHIEQLIDHFNKILQIRVKKGHLSLVPRVSKDNFDDAEEELSCAFHIGSPGHNLKSCRKWLRYWHLRS